MPYAFIANAANFVLAISNATSIVLYGDHAPHLLAWLKNFGLASVVSIAATYVGLKVIEGPRLAGQCECDLPSQPLSLGGLAPLIGIAATANVLLGVSALDRPLGLPTCTMEGLTAAIVWQKSREAHWAILRSISWADLRLAAGLFIMVEARPRQA